MFIYMIPLILRLKRESHKQIALAQDIIVQEMYKIFNDAVARRNRHMEMLQREKIL